MDFDIRQLASAAKLRITEDELEDYEKRMAAAIAMVQQLPGIEVEDVERLPELLKTMSLRPDEVQPSASREQILQNAPRVADWCFVVPDTLG